MNLTQDRPWLRRLDLTPVRYYQAIGGYYDADPAMHVPTGLARGHADAALRDEEPTTRKGAGWPYSPEEIAFFWDEARRVPLQLKPKLRAKLESRQADRRLWEAVRNWAGRRSVFTVTGRLRAYLLWQPQHHLPGGGGRRRLRPVAGLARPGTGSSTSYTTNWLSRRATTGFHNTSLSSRR